MLNKCGNSLKFNGGRFVLQSMEIARSLFFSPPGRIMRDSAEDILCGFALEMKEDWDLPARCKQFWFSTGSYRPLAANFGRVYAAYGGIFIFLSILWGWQIDRIAPDRFDLIGGFIALIGVIIIMYWPRA
jgi:drug/metabolite transporter superfamily protein YnfA